MQDKPRVLMFGPALTATSGIANVVNNWLGANLNGVVRLEYISTLDDYVPGHYIVKTLNALRAHKVLWSKRNDPIDIVHIHLSHGMSFYRKLTIFWLAKKFGMKVVVHLHGSQFEEFYEDGSRLQQRLVRQMFDHADGILVLSKYWKEFIQKISTNQNIYLIYNGAPLNIGSENNSQNGQTVIAFMGRLGSRKGTYDLLMAFEKLSSEVPDAKLVLGGDGEIDTVKQWVESHHLADRVDVLGWVSGDDKDKVFRQADIYALPSYNEGLPGSVLEAMATSTPIISTPVGGIPEAVIENQNGFLVKPGDVNLLYQRLLKLCQDKDCCQRMGKESRRLVEDKFNLEHIINDLNKAYKKVIRHKNEHVESPI